jgi:endoribonuclease Dicer
MSLNTPVPVPQQTYTTSESHVLTPTNAPIILNAYLQSFPFDPSHFRHEVTYTIHPHPDPPKRGRPTKPLDPGQPPVDSLFHAHITLPAACGGGGEGGGYSVSSEGVGWRSKDLAKRDVMFRLVRVLIEDGGVSQDLKPCSKRAEEMWGKNGKGQGAIKREIRFNDRLAKQIGNGIGTGEGPAEGENKGEHVSLTKKMEGMRNAVKDRIPPKSIASDGSLGTGLYDFKVNPDYWDGNPVFTLENLYVTIMEVILDPPNEAQQGLCRKVCLLTTRELPVFLQNGGPAQGGQDGQSRQSRRGEIDDGKVDIDVSVAGIGNERVEIGAKVRLKKGGKLDKLQDGKLEEILAYTQRLIRAHLNRPIQTTLQTAKWLVVPLVPEFSTSTPSGTASQSHIHHDDIAWFEISLALGPAATPFSLDPSVLRVQIQDAITTSRAEFSRRFYINSLSTHLTPLSPHPSRSNSLIKDVKPIRHDYGTPPPPLTSLTQPILECTQIYPTKSGGFISGLGLESQSALKTDYLIPELVYRHSIPASVYRTTSILPTLLTSINDQLLANEINERFFNGVLKPELALQAMTTSTQQPLMQHRTYQRLEYLGDTLLKLIATVYHHLKDVEQQKRGMVGDVEKMHLDRHVMVSNRSLMGWLVALKREDMRGGEKGRVGLVEYIRGRPVRRGEWVPLGWEVERVVGERISDDGKQLLGDKVGLPIPTLLCHHIFPPCSLLPTTIL